MLFSRVLQPLALHSIRYTRGSFQICLRAETTRHTTNICTRIGLGLFYSSFNSLISRGRYSARREVKVDVITGKSNARTRSIKRALIHGTWVVNADGTMRSPQWNL